MSEELKSIHKAFINFTRRAEKKTSEILVKTFVDTAPLFDILSTNNNQVVYGRRGTGKTHALKYLAEYVNEKDNQFALYVDMRTVGSDGAMYHDTSKPASERSIRLILDVLNLIADWTAPVEWSSLNVSA